MDQSVKKAPKGQQNQTQALSDDELLALIQQTVKVPGFDAAYYQGSDPKLQDRAKKSLAKLRKLKDDVKALSSRRNAVVKDLVRPMVPMTTLATQIGNDLTKLNGRTTNKALVRSRAYRWAQVWRIAWDYYKDLLTYADDLTKHRSRAWFVSRHWPFDVAYPKREHQDKPDYWSGFLGQSITPQDMDNLPKNVMSFGQMTKIARRIVDSDNPARDEWGNLVPEPEQWRVSRLLTQEAMAHGWTNFGDGWDGAGYVINTDDHGHPLLGDDTWADAQFQRVKALYEQGCKAQRGTDPDPLVAMIFHTRDRVGSKGDESTADLLDAHYHAVIGLPKDKSCYQMMISLGEDLQMIREWAGEIYDLHHRKHNLDKADDYADLFDRLNCLIHTARGQVVNYRPVKDRLAALRYLTHPNDEGRVKVTYSVNEVLLLTPHGDTYSQLTGLYDKVAGTVGHADVVALVHSPYGIEHGLPDKVGRKKTDQCWYTYGDLEALRRVYYQRGELAMFSAFWQAVAVGTFAPTDFLDVLAGILPAEVYDRLLTAHSGGNSLLARYKARLQQWINTASRGKPLADPVWTYIYSSTGGSGKSSIAGALATLMTGRGDIYETAQATDTTSDPFGHYDGQSSVVINEASAGLMSWPAWKLLLDPHPTQPLKVGSRQEDKVLYALRYGYLTQVMDPLAMIGSILRYSKGATAAGHVAYSKALDRWIIKPESYFGGLSQLARRLPVVVRIEMAGPNRTEVTVSHINFESSFVPAWSTLGDPIDWMREHLGYVHLKNTVHTFNFSLATSTSDEEHAARSLTIARWVKSAIARLKDAVADWYQAHPDTGLIDPDDPTLLWTYGMSDVTDPDHLMPQPDPAPTPQPQPDPAPEPEPQSSLLPVVTIPSHAPVDVSYVYNRSWLDRCHDDDLVNGLVYRALSCVDPENTAPNIYVGGSIQRSGWAVDVPGGYSCGPYTVVVWRDDERDYHYALVNSYLWRGVNGSDHGISDFARLINDMDLDADPDADWVDNCNCVLDKLDLILIGRACRTECQWRTDSAGRPQMMMSSRIRALVRSLYTNYIVDETPLLSAPTA